MTKKSSSSTCKSKNNINNNLIFLIHFILWIFITVAVVKYVFIPAINTTNQSVIYYNNEGKASLLDFPWILNFTKNFWKNQKHPQTSIYTVENHLLVTSQWTGTDSKNSLSFGYSPTMLWLLAPLVNFTTATAFCIFNFLGLLAIWWQTRPTRCKFGVGLLGYLSPVAMGCFVNGQTALLTGAGLLFLAEQSRRGFKRFASLQTVISSVVLWALTAKPPLALTAVIVLLALRQWRTVLLAALLLIVTTLTISPRMGPDWMTDYLHLIIKYDQIQADPAFKACLATEHMANLRGVLSVDFNLPDNTSSRISSIIWLTTLVMFVAVGPRLCLTVGGFWSAGLLLYLLFCPHVSSTEILQVVLLLPFCIPINKEKMQWNALLLLFTIPLLPFSSPILFDNRIFLFSGLLFMLFFVTFTTRAKMFPNSI